MLVSYYPEHAGHELNITHIRLRREQREQIAAKLASGITYDDVLDSMHATVNSSGLNNLQFLWCKKDVHNIAHEFWTNKGKVLHKNDADGVAAWIERTKLDVSTQNLIRLVKFQGESLTYSLRDDDFMLTIASDAQLVGTKAFCGPMKEVCMDSTQGMNSYEFQLTTLMAIDEH